MFNFILPLLKNPLTKIIADKTIGAIQHKLEKDNIIKAKELEAASKESGSKSGGEPQMVQTRELGLIPALKIKE